MSGGGRKAATPGGEEAEVEALIRAAQDAVLLKLQANSHLVSSTPAASASSTPPSLDAAALDPLDSDLARRFDALKSRAAAPKPTPAGAGAGAAVGGMDELEARFAALKGAAAGPEKETRVRLEDLGGESSEDEADEVDKVMRWAMDAARLDVAAAGTAGGKAKKRADDEEEEKDEKSSVSSEDEEEDEEERLRLEMARKKEMAKTKSKNKWFFL
ncbi:hypothetical protein BDA96_07G041000 [Sorghum bicolor]|uniref:Uncharacterized protein n=2 Tax=Sorghum bicolor TaxID=4558 RepID=A0A921QJ00_SORBI|nr:nucleolin [Sorghum bicolor]EES13345.1 hypothetical protein SORBI_3007G038900 [Sorghum bicolor]KAG0522481.1 hypothetical protein BDA96_07G041000 [Sorghum bicolor]|eukprot:XP_002443850.1 nucleolin [Sorghum bicolor]